MAHFLQGCAGWFAIPACIASMLAKCCISLVASTSVTHIDQHHLCTLGKQVLLVTIFFGGGACFWGWPRTISQFSTAPLQGSSQLPSQCLIALSIAQLCAQQ